MVSIANISCRFLKILFIATILLLSYNLKSQSTIQLQFTPIGIHPFTETNLHLFENKIDANGLFIIEPCLILGYDNFILEDILSWRCKLGFLNDAAAHPAFLLHLGLKQRIIQIWRNSFAVGLGLNLHGRESWSNITGYIPESNWKKNGDWEYKFGLLCEIEYSFFINDKNDITISGIYGHQHKTFTFTIGYKYWLSSTIKHPRKCGSCPFGNGSKHWTP